MQQLNPSEISDIIRQRIDQLDVGSEARNEGTVVSVTDGIIRIHGLQDVMYGEMIEFDGGIYGMALNLERDSVGAVILGDYKGLAEGQSCRCTGRILEVPVGPELQGRVVDALGTPIDGKGPIDAGMTDALEKVAPGVIARQSVDQPVQIGLKAIDAMVPIGRGQRELIIGDRQIGKTAIAVDAIINQKGTGIKCIYVAVGQKASSVAAVVRKLEEHGAMEHTIVVAATAGKTRSSSTMTSPSRPGPTARSPCCCAARRAAKRTPVTSSTCTRASSSARRGSTPTTSSSSPTARSRARPVPLPPCR